MTTNRSGHTATRLASGKVLIAGGKGTSSENATAELYDPDEDTFTSTAGPMSQARTAHTAMLLPSGKVLVAGGMSGTAAISTSELFNPGTGLFESTGTHDIGRAVSTPPHGCWTAESCWPVDTTALTISRRPRFTTPRKEPARRRREAWPHSEGRHTATLLSDGTVLLAGGSDANGAVQTAELYDPSTDTFTLLSDQMTSPRTGHTATLVSKDEVVLIGGSNGTDALDTAEIYDVSSRSFTAVTDTMASARTGHTATALQFGGEGYVRATCKAGLLFTEYYSSTRDNAALNGIDVYKYAGVTRLYSPQFANIGSFKTYLSLINANPDQDAR